MPPHLLGLSQGRQPRPAVGHLARVSVLLYILGLSYGAVSEVLEALG